MKSKLLIAALPLAFVAYMVYEAAVVLAAIGSKLP